MDKELLELCAMVHKKTGWESHQMMAAMFEYLHEWDSKSVRSIVPPLYTSDYLLEKLPNMLRVRRPDMQYQVRFAFKLRTPISGKPNWRAGYYNTPSKQDLRGLGIEAMADTPLKALLKLVINLSEEGQL